MKRNVIVLLFAVVSTLFMSSCAKVDSAVVGTAIATPDTVKNGDEVTFSIGGNVAVSGTSSMNGREYYPIIHYLIDGEEVAKSSDKGLPFKANYTVKDLSLGEHSLTVEITASRKTANYENLVKSSTITVTE